MSEDQKPQEQTPVDRFHDRVGKLYGGVPGRPILGAAEERHTAGIPGNTIGGSTSNPWASLDEECKRIREELRLVGPKIVKLHNHPRAGAGYPDSDEINANLQLAYRHTEDAVMRLGKAIQAYDGGRSVYYR